MPLSIVKTVVFCPWKVKNLNNLYTIPNLCHWDILEFYVSMNALFTDDIYSAL